MLSQSEPEESKATVGRPPSAVTDDLAQPGAAVPRSLMDSKPAFRRFVNRRTMFWLALTAAVVIMIKINEEKHRVPMANNAAREVAQAPACARPVGPRAASAVEHRHRPRQVGGVVPQSSGARRSEARGGAGCRCRRRIAEQAVCRGPVRAERGGREGPTRRRRAAARRGGAVRSQIPRPTGRQEASRRGPVGGPLRHQPPGRQERSLR